MASPANVTISPISQTPRARPEWEVIDLESGTCTTQVYLFPDEVNDKEIWSQEHASTPDSAANTVSPTTASRRLYWSHSLISWSPANTSAAMSNGHSSPALEDSQKDPRIRSKSTLSRLRGDEKVYVPRRAISLGNLPLTSASPIVQASSRVYTSMLMTKDITMTNSIVNHSTEAPLAPPPLVQVSSLMDMSAANIPPRSPKSKFTPTFPPLDENTALNLKPQAYRRLLLSLELSVQATKLKLPNPFISITRKNGSVDVSLKYNTMPIYSITVDPEGNNSEICLRKQQVTGPYRSAAVWEFVGQTFGKYERYKKLKPKKKKVIRDCLERLTPTSGLANQILADDNDDKNMFDDAEVRAEWTNFVNSTDNLDRSPSHHISRLPTLQEKDFSNSQLEDRRGRSRTRSDLLDRHSMEKMLPDSNFSSLAMPHTVHENTVPEETDVTDECREETSNTGKVAIVQKETSGLGLSFW